MRSGRWPRDTSRRDTAVNTTTQPSVMVVHHDPWTRSSLLEALRAAGFNVEEASNGMSALRRALVTVPHIVVLESKLPELSGPELVFELRNDPRTRHAAIVGVHDVVGSDASLDLPCTP